jgi:hypothetical protein
MKHRRFNQCKITVHISFLVTILLATSLISVGQTNIAVAPTKMNVFYIGVDNPVSVAASGAADDNITVSISGGGGTVTKTETGHYNVQVAKITDECLMNVYVDGKLAGTSSFRVRSLPLAFATVGGFTYGETIPADAFRSQVGVGCYLKDFPFPVKYEVLGFKFNVADEKGTVLSADCQGNVFSSLAKKYIDQYVKDGRTVTIDNIRAKDPSGKEVELPALMYAIK